MKYLWNQLVRFRWLCWNFYQRHLRRRPKVTIETTYTIYVRESGCDETGTGYSVQTAYVTMARAVRDVPAHIPAGTSYVIDVNGLFGSPIKHAEVNLTASKEAEERELAIRYCQKLLGETKE